LALGVAATSGCSLVGASDTNIDRIPGLEFGGSTYRAAIAPTAQIEAADVQKIRPATHIDDESIVVGTDVYALNGVDRSILVVMPSSDPANGPYVLFVRDGAIPPPSQGSSSESTLAEFVGSVPGLCRYFPDVSC
jgi:hypothetical protein